MKDMRSYKLSNVHYFYYSSKIASVDSPMHYGRGDIQSFEAKIKTYELANRFMADFKSKMGSCTCESILGLNIGIPVNLERAKELKLFETRCLDSVKAASDILEELI